MTRAERFEAKYIRCPMSGCWLWTATVRRGYGMFSITGKSGEKVGAHRASWIFHVGTIPDGLWVLHRCDVPSCVNPAHLFLGTHDDNMADKVAKGRQVHLRGELCRTAKLTERAVLAIRADPRTLGPIAADYGVSMQTICSVKRRRRWEHVA